MIDFFSITLDIKHKPFGSVRTKQDEDGVVKTAYYSKTMYINHVPYFVTSLNDGAQVNIRCCPAKVLQGHNLFGTNSLKKLVCPIIFGTMDQLGIQVSDNQLREWKRGEFDVDEIHITHRFPVAEYPMVRQLISHIRRYASERLLPTPIRKGVGVSLRAPHGQADWLFYDKHQEFGDKRTKEQKYLQAVIGDDAKSATVMLLRTASKSVRAELKSGKQYLQDRGLDRGNAWTSSKAIEVFTNEFGLLGIGHKIPALPQLAEVYASISNPKVRAVVIMWANGEDIANHYKESTVRKYRAAVLDELGIDIVKDQPALETASLNMADMFDTSHMLVGFPKWTRHYPRLSLR
jgi:hypothetical protein